jgi:hypothetical protein
MGFVDRLTGKTAAKAAKKGAKVQSEAIDKAMPVVSEGFESARTEVQKAVDSALGRFDQFRDVERQAINQAAFLTDPQAQFEFLQNNPMFKAALENANLQTQSSAAARGRLAAGDTLQQLSQNTLLAAQPLIQDQKQSIANLLGMSTGLASERAGLDRFLGGNLAGLSTQEAASISNLITGQGAVEAGGIVGAENARSQALGSLVSNVAALGGAALGNPSFF